MARNTMRLDLSGFKELMGKLDALGGDLKEATEEALGDVADIITQDTKKAMDKSHLPRKGIYSTGDTMKSIEEDQEVEWEGMTGSVGVGFDYDKPGAGGYLISGTPKMKPNMWLKSMYKGKKYMNQIRNQIEDDINLIIKERMEG